MQKQIIREPDEVAMSIRAYLADRPCDSQWAEASNSLLGGHCYVASEVYYHMTERKFELTPMQVSFEVNHPHFEGEVSHWFLEDLDNRVIDLTAEQFDPLGVNVPYDEATGRGFVPPSPSSRSENVITTLQEREL